MKNIIEKIGHIKYYINKSIKKKKKKFKKKLETPFVIQGKMRPPGRGPCLTKEKRGRGVVSKT